MITKEQTNELTKKWELLLNSLSYPKDVKYKFARVLEKIIEYNEPQNVKMLISIALNVFKKLSAFKSTKSKKNENFIIEYNESELYDGYNINMEKAISFIDSAADMIINEIVKVGRMSYLKYDKGKLYLIY